MAINATSEGKEVTLHTHFESKSETTTNHKKIINNIFEISAVHEFADSLHEVGEEGKYGYDWYFIKQAPLLNGAPGYDFHWAGTRQVVWTKQKNNTQKQESWYIGQGEVALNYVSAYTMESFFPVSPNVVTLHEVKPTALNETREQTISNSTSIGGAFSGGVSSENGLHGEGQASLNWGLNFQESETTIIYDCTCKSYTDGSKVKWEYTFRKPDYHYQRIKNVPELSHSTFNPVNLWIWRVPTKYRKDITSFKSIITIDVSSIITRYSGSQPAKVIPALSDSVSFDIPLPVPPLLSCQTDYISVDRNGGTKNVAIMTEYENLKITFDGKTSCDWIKVNHLRAHTEKSVLEITVNALEEAQGNRSCTIKVSGDNGGKVLSYQRSSEVKESIELVVSQSKDLVK
ncbi:hypothetical protein WKT02_00985 [Erysipelotrichaceae bacterium HCN-30851]